MSAVNETSSILGIRKPEEDPIDQPAPKRLETLTEAILKVESVVQPGFREKAFYKFPNGGTYKGTTLNEKMHGRGTLKLPDGSKYKGDFKDGLREGKGTFIFPNKAKYVGDFKDDFMEGNGVFTFPCGTKYNGPFKADLFDGVGTLQSPKAKYNGEFFKQKMHGKGSLSFKREPTEDGKKSTEDGGEAFVGEFFEDKMKKGTFSFWVGQKNYVYIGEFPDGEMKGPGTLFSGDGDKGKIENGILTGMKQQVELPRFVNGNIVPN